MVSNYPYYQQQQQQQQNSGPGWGTALGVGAVGLGALGMTPWGRGMIGRGGRGISSALEDAGAGLERAGYMGTGEMVGKAAQGMSRATNATTGALEDAANWGKNAMANPGAAGNQVGTAINEGLNNFANGANGVAQGIRSATQGFGEGSSAVTNKLFRDSLLAKGEKVAAGAEKFDNARQAAAYSIVSSATKDAPPPTVGAVNKIAKQFTQIQQQEAKLAKATSTQESQDVVESIQKRLAKLTDWSKVGTEGMQGINIPQALQHFKELHSTNVAPPQGMSTGLRTALGLGAVGAAGGGAYAYNQNQGY